VLVDEGPALIGVAFQARFFISLLLIDHVGSHAHPPACREGPVGIVAIRALDGPFVYTMLERHRELRLHRRVAGITKLGLLPGEKKSRRLRIMNRVAIRADHVRLRVSTPADVGARKRLRVAAEAGVKRFLGSDFRECDDGRLAAVSLDVSLPRSMAAFAARVFRRFLAAGDAFVMRVAEELVPNRGMACFAGVTANVISATGNYGQKKSGLSRSNECHYLI